VRSFPQNIEAEHEQFTMNARRSLDRILDHHAKYQFAALFRDPFPTHVLACSGDPPPVHPKASTMPADDSLRGYDDEAGFPSRPEPPSSYPEQSID
jgi:hypothetical protein